MIFNNHKNKVADLDIVIGRTKINRVSSCKFLGVEIDEKLTWLPHIKQVEKKISSALFMIRHIRYKINRTTALKLYDTLILPYLNYCNILWGNAYKSHTSNIFRLQKRALKLCHTLKMQASDNLFIITNKMSFYDIHKLQTAQLVFQYFHHEKLLPKCIHIVIVIIISLIYNIYL